MVIYILKGSRGGRPRHFTNIEILLSVIRKDLELKRDNKDTSKTTVELRFE